MCVKESLSVCVDVCASTSSDSKNSSKRENRIIALTKSIGIFTFFFLSSSTIRFWSFDFVRAEDTVRMIQVAIELRTGEENPVDFYPIEINSWVRLPTCVRQVDVNRTDNSSDLIHIYRTGFCVRIFFFLFRRFLDGIFYVIECKWNTIIFSQIFFANTETLFVVLCRSYYTRLVHRH